MKTKQRRASIAAFLLSKTEAVPGASLSKSFGVSRQIIVQDIAALKAKGYEIRATHFGYVLQKSPLTERVFEVFHTREKTEDELKLIVSLGGIVVDVYVWHKVFGKIRAELNLYDTAGIEAFISGVRDGTSVELMSLTGGHHYHTVCADSEQTLEQIAVALREQGYIASGS